MGKGNKDLNRRIKRKVREIAESFTNNQFVPKDDPGLFCGKTGLALFLFYYSLEYGDQLKYNKAARLIHDVLNKDLLKFSHPSFSEGVAGIAWAVDYINEQGFMSFKLRDFCNLFCKISSNICWVVFVLAYFINSSLAFSRRAFLTALETFLLVIKKGFILNWASLQSVEKESST